MDAATNATINEPVNWSNWLVLSRVDAEAGNAKAAAAAYGQVRLLNPKLAVSGQ